MCIELRDHATGGDAVTGRPVLGHSQRHILGIGQYTALAGTVFRELRAVVGTDRGRHDDRLNVGLNPILFRAVNGTPQVDINVTSAILDACVINKYIHFANLRKLLLAGNIYDVMGVSIMVNGALRHIKSDDIIALSQKFLCDPTADSRAGSGYQNFHRQSISLNRMLLFLQVFFATIWTSVSQNDVTIKII